MNRLLLVKLGAEQDRHLDADEVVCKIAAELACCEVSEPIVGCNVTGVSLVMAVEDLMLEFWGFVAWSGGGRKRAGVATKEGAAG